MTKRALEGGAVPLSISGQSSRLRLERLDLLVKTAQQLTAQARLIESRDLLLQVVERDPANADAHLTLAIAYEAMGCIEESVAAFEDAVAAAPDNPTLVSASAFACDRSPSSTFEDGYKIRRRFNEMITRRMPPILPHLNNRAPDRKLRVGYVSGDLRQHSASKVFGTVLLKHDPKQFDVCAYSTNPGEDWLTETLKAGIPYWRDATVWSNEQLYAQIRADEIDILVDLSGHSAGNRLPVFARKPAPVQVTAWGYITGTGLDAVDYIFADADTIRPDEERWFSERVVRLPRIVPYWPTDPSVVGPVEPLPCLKNGYLTYGVVNRLGKLKLGTIELWARILAQVPDARLVIKAMGMEHPEIRLMVQQRFEQFGTDIGRLQFRGSTDPIAHQKTFNEIDVGLDPWPDGGGVSTLEALWMGVPSVTFPYRQIASRLTSSFQAELGLPWLSASSPDEYVERAVALNSQRGELAAVRRVLRDLMCSSALCDTLPYVRTVEAHYRDFWRRWCDQQNGVVPITAPALTLVGA